MGKPSDNYLCPAMRVSLHWDVTPSDLANPRRHDAEQGLVAVRRRVKLIVVHLFSALEIWLPPIITSSFYVP